MVKVARYNNSLAAPSIFESLIFKEIDLYGETIITHTPNCSNVVMEKSKNQNPK